MGLLLICSSSAAEIYKSVDENGNIRYSSVPPASNQLVEILQMPSEPSEEEVKAAQQRQQEFEKELVKRKEVRSEQKQKNLTQRENSSPTATPNISPPVPIFYSRRH